MKHKYWINGRSLCNIVTPRNGQGDDIFAENDFQVECLLCRRFMFIYPAGVRAR